jgi:hypothetical protein
MEEIQERMAEERAKTCTYCGDGIGPFERDHVYPKWRGGSDKESNLVWACRRCNQLKRGMRVDLFLDNLRQVREGRLRVITGRRGPKFQRVYVRVVKDKPPPRVGMTKRELLWESNRRKSP